MASGDTLFVFLAGGRTAVGTNDARREFLAAATGKRDLLAFTGSSVDEVAIWGDVWPSQYDGGGVDFAVGYFPDGTATGAVQWEGSFETLSDGDDGASGGVDFGTVTDVTDTPTGTADELHITATGAISHANCGSPSSGEPCRFRLARDHDHASNTDDQRVYFVLVTEQ